MTSSAPQSTPKITIPTAISAGTSQSSDSNSTVVCGSAGLSATPELKNGSIPSGSRSEIHYPTIKHNINNIYQSKKNKKLVRLMTVIGYIFAVSLVAIVLSLYYVFFWNPYTATFFNQNLSQYMISSLNQSRKVYTKFQPNEKYETSVINESAIIVQHKYPTRGEIQPKPTPAIITDAINEINSTSVNGDNDWLDIIDAGEHTVSSVYNIDEHNQQLIKSSRPNLRVANAVGDNSTDKN